MKSLAEKETERMVRSMLVFAVALMCMGAFLPDCWAFR